jgi:hypothetical protein
MGYGRVNQHKDNSSSSAPVVLILGLIAFAFALVMVGLSLENADANNADVKTGEVRLTGSIGKICDGPNLIYTVYANGIAVSPNDPQCN